MQELLGQTGTELVGSIDYRFLWVKMSQKRITLNNKVILQHFFLFQEMWQIKFNIASEIAVQNMSASHGVQFWGWGNRWTRHIALHSRFKFNTWQYTSNASFICV